MLLLHHHRLKLAAGVGIAPTSRAFQTRAHLSMPSSVLIGAHTRYRASVFPLSTDCSALELCGQKWCVRRELHPRCSPLGNGFTGRCDTSDSRLTRIEIVGHARELSLAARSRLPCGCSFKHIGCIRSPACADHSLAREVCSNEICPCGRICTRTVPFLRRTPLLGWATQGKNGCHGWIRTIIAGSRIRCPTVGRHGKLKCFWSSRQDLHPDHAHI